MDEPTERFPSGAAPGRQNTAPMPPVYPPYPPYPPAPQGRYPGYPPVAPQTHAARQARMPKERAQQIIRSLRTWIAAGSIVAFGVLAGLAASHVTGVTAATPNTTQQNAPASNPNVNNGDDGGGFFTQQPGGFGVGSGNFGQAPFTSSSSS